MKKQNSPSYTHERYISQMTNFPEPINLMYSSNFINQPGRKSIRASGTEIHNQHTIKSDNDLSAHETGICHALTGLTNRQRYICLQHSGLIWAMLEGTHLGMHECVHQFQHEQWNCSAVNLLYRLHMKSSSLPSIHGLEGILQRGKFYF
ncbi:unnamed protein product [Trichobilharzia regenti]|nr:unnamed protein product [Trichobilharzia regenti]